MILELSLDNYTIVSVNNFCSIKFDNKDGLDIFQITIPSTKLEEFENAVKNSNSESQLVSHLQNLEKLIHRD